MEYNSREEAIEAAVEFIMEMMRNGKDGAFEARTAGTPGICVSSDGPADDYFHYPPEDVPIGKCPFCGGECKLTMGEMICPEYSGKMIACQEIDCPYVSRPCDNAADAIRYHNRVFRRLSVGV